MTRVRPLGQVYMTIEEPKARNRRKRPAAPNTPDPVEIAMAIAASGHTPAAAAIAVLHANAALMNDQAGLTREQIGLSRKQLVLAGNEIFRNRIKAIRDIAIAAVVIGLLVAAGTVVWSGSRSTGLVIQPFSVPPELAERGLTGEVVAIQMLDRLAALNMESSATLRAADTFANDWSEGIDIDIPQTGVSIDEFDRWLREKLGSQTRLSGEVVRSTDGQLTVTVRTAGEPSSSLTGPEADLDGLLARSAERIYALTQPYRYAVGLRAKGRDDQATAVYAELARTGPAAERAWGEVGLASGLAQTSERASLEASRRAAALDPANALTFANWGMSARRLGRTEEALVAQVSAVRGFRGSNGSIRADARATYRSRVSGILALMEGDLALADQTFHSISSQDDVGASTPTPYFHAEALVRLHRPGDASALISRTANNNALSVLNVVERNSIARAEVLMLADLERGEPVSVLARRRAVLALVGDWPAAREHDRYRLQPLEAEALARLGRGAEAEGLAAALPVDCEPCLRAKGRVAALRGDDREADRWFAEAVQQSPSTPFSRSAWGQARLARGDAAGAIRLFRQAHERSPRWADPLKFWGDSLLAQGDERRAIQKYRAAAERAPRWGSLHFAWGRALEAQRRRDQARRKYAEAADMDLSAADRAEVVRRLAAVSRGS